jgi:biopolymer transport protein TolR
MKTRESGARNRKHHGLAIPCINVTPLIDVLLVLLIIFMVIQPQREAKFETQIPREPDKEHSEEVPEPDLLMVDVKGGIGLEQTIELNSRPMTLIELSATLRELLEQRLDKTIYLKAPRGKEYGDIIYVIDTLKGAGAGRIGLQIDFLS